jgi:hypothetical protein
MFETIDQVPWKKLRHCRGSAADVPQILRNLTSEDKDIVDEAVNEGLWDKLCNQYTLYEASPYVIPFLLELLRDGHLDGKKTRADVLSYLAICGSGADRGKHRKTIPLLDWLRSLLPSHSQDLYMREQLLKGKEVYRRFAQDKNCEVQWHANQLLEWCGAPWGRFEWKSFDYKNNPIRES